MIIRDANRPYRGPIQLKFIDNVSIAVEIVTL